MEKFKKKKYLQFLVYHSPLLLSSIIPNHPNFPSITKLITLHTHTHIHLRMEIARKAST